VPMTLWVESIGVVELVVLTVLALLTEGWGSLRKRP